MAASGKGKVGKIISSTNDLNKRFKKPIRLYYSAVNPNVSNIGFEIESELSKIESDRYSTISEEL